MSDNVIPAAEFARRRAERERQRRRREAFAGSILAPLDQGDQPCTPASPARDRETLR